MGAVAFPAGRGRKKRLFCRLLSRWRAENIGAQNVTGNAGFLFNAQRVLCRDDLPGMNQLARNAEPSGEELRPACAGFGGLACNGARIRWINFLCSHSCINESRIFTRDQDILRISLWQVKLACGMVELRWGKCTCDEREKAIREPR